MFKFITQYFENEITLDQKIFDQGALDKEFFNSINMPKSSTAKNTPQKDTNVTTQPKPSHSSVEPSAIAVKASSEASENALQDPKTDELIASMPKIDIDSEQIDAIPSASSKDVVAVERNKALIKKFERAFEALNHAELFAKGNYQTDLFQMADLLIATEDGLRYLYKKAPQFDKAGIFYNGPWEKAEKLMPELVRGGLMSHGVFPTLEVLSELRILSIAQGDYIHEKFSAQQALDFLSKVVALNFEFIFPKHTEETRTNPQPNQALCERLFALIIEELPIETLLDDVISEIEQICAQRPIMNKHLIKMVELAERIPLLSSDTKQLEKYTNAVKGLSPLGADVAHYAEYRERLQLASVDDIKLEAEFFADGLNETGLSSPNHAVLLRYLERNHPELIGPALGLNATGLAEFEQNEIFARRLTRFAILPTTFRCIYGFAKLLERSLLSRKEITAGMERLVDLDLTSEVRHNLLSQREYQDGVTANSILMAGVIMVLGQPLGIGQGKNPTCQAARAISLWSQHAPGHLLAILISAASEGFIELPFEGENIMSNTLTGGLSETIDLDIDPVSMVLVSHLDRLYDELMLRASARNEDGHKWVNPALYGHWVPNEFSSIFDKLGVVNNYQDFIRLFFATHNPSFNSGHSLMYPNPVGLLITSTHGDLLGPHAVSIQRVGRDSEGRLRVYFYNPNNESRQNWGQDIEPSVIGFGEEEGESSLPFEEFASRLYAFHYNPYEVGDGFAVPSDIIEGIETLAKESWGKSYTWK
jgi:hypothetical protein